MNSKEKVVEYFLQNPTASNIEISAHTGVSKSSVQRYLSDPSIGDIPIPQLDRTISEQILVNTRAARQKGGRTTFKKYAAQKNESGKFIGLAKEEVTTDKEEYKHGEKLTLSLTSKKENGENADAAILVSILDEAILSLADNDLSIDNIKLALQDIELSDGVTAADLYAEILD